jgi:hypothetical protein
LALRALGKHRGVCVLRREDADAMDHKPADTTRISVSFRDQQFEGMRKVCGAFLGRIFISEHGWVGWFAIKRVWQ